MEQDLWTTEGTETARELRAESFERRVDTKRDTDPSRITGD